MTPRPFQPAIDPEFFWLGGPHEAAHGALRGAILRGAGVVVLTGDVGTGKSMLGHVLMDDLAREGVKVARMTYPTVEPLDFLGGVAEAFGFEVDLGSTDAFHGSFRRALRHAFNRSERLLLVVDEAQALSPALLTEIGRLARGASTAGRGQQAAMSILLIGQPDLTARIQQGDHAGLEHRIRTAYRLGPLNEAQVEEYVRHRLAVARLASPRFDGNAILEIHAFSGGIPRLVNSVCDGALKMAERQGADVVDRNLVRACLDGPRWREDEEPVGRRPREAWRAVRERMAGRARTAALAVSAGAAVLAVAATVTWYVRQPSAETPPVPVLSTSPAPAGEDSAGSGARNASDSAAGAAAAEAPAPGVPLGTSAVAEPPAADPAAGTPATGAPGVAAEVTPRADAQARAAPDPPGGPGSSGGSSLPAASSAPAVSPAPAGPSGPGLPGRPGAVAGDRGGTAAGSGRAAGAAMPPAAERRPGTATETAARSEGTSVDTRRSLAPAPPPAPAVETPRRRPEETAAKPAPRAEAPAPSAPAPGPPPARRADPPAPARAAAPRPSAAEAPDPGGIIDWLLEEFRPGRN